MHVETITKTEAVKIEKNIIRYSGEDIANLIRKDLEHNGYTATVINFETDYKNVSDEWGMNSHTTSFFKGVIVEL